MPSTRSPRDSNARAVEKPMNPATPVTRNVIGRTYPPERQKRILIAARAQRVQRTSMSKPSIRIGIGGWTFPPWRGVFYPDKLPQSKELEYASSQLSAIEINATFYGRQS